MPDIEQLNIQISGSSNKARQSIDDLIKNLGRLNQALNNYSDGSSYIKGLNLLAGGLNSMSEAISGIDAGKVKGNNLSQLSFAKTFTQLGASAEKSSIQVKRTVEELSKAFGIKSKEGITELTDSVSKFYSSLNDGKGMKAAEDDIKSVISSYAELEKVVDETYEKVRNWMSNTTFAIPKGSVDEFVDDFKRMRGVLGISNTTTDISKGMGLDTVIPEMNQALGTSFDADNVLNGLRQIVDFLEQGRNAQEEYTEQQRQGILVSQELATAMDNLYASVGKVREVMTDDTMLGDTDGIGFDVNLEDLQSGANNVSQAVEQVKAESEQVVQIGNPFEGIVNGLNSLININISGEQFTGVKILADSLGRLTGVNSEKAAESIPKIASGLRSLQGLEIPNFGTELYVLADGLAQLGTKAMERAQGLPELARGLRELSDIKEVPSLPGLAELAASLSKMGGKYATQAIQNIPDLAMSFNYLVSTVSKAPQVSQETLRLAEAMAQLATASRSAGQSTQQSSTGINMIRGAVSAALPSFNKAQKKTFSLASMFGKLYASYFLVIRAFRGIGGAIENASKLTEVGNVVATVFGEEKEVLEDFADTAIMNFGMAELSAKQFASRFQAMGSAMGLTNKQVAQANEFLDSELQGQKRIVEGVADSYEDLGKSTADMSINLTKLVADYASFYDVDYEDVAKDFEAIFTGQTRPMRAYGIDLTNATLKEWALKEGLDADIESMTQAEKTMLRYQYTLAHSGKVMNDFAITADSWANVIRNIGQLITQIGVKMGSGLINIFKPALIGFRDFLNTFLGLAEKGMNAVGKLLGWQIKLDEVGVSMEDEMSDYADDLGDAAGNAKKLNSQLRAIDELNNLTSPNKGGSGSGGLDLSAGAGGATGGGIRFEEVPGVFESDIESWKELGERIRDKILEGFNTIQWGDISGKVKLNASGFANLINGLLEPDEAKETIGGAFGTFLAEGINLGFDWLVTFTKTLEWEQVGGNIADFVNNFFENIDAKDMADTVNNVADGIWKVFITALVGDKDKNIKGIDGKKVASKIGEFLKNISPETWALGIGALAIKLGSVTISNVTNWFFSDALKKLFVDKVASKLNKSKVDVDELEVGAVPNMKITGADVLAYAVAAAIGAEIGRIAIAPMIYGEDGIFTWGEIGEGFQDIFSDKQMFTNFAKSWAEDQNILGTLGVVLRDTGKIDDDWWHFLSFSYTIDDFKKDWVDALDIMKGDAISIAQEMKDNEAVKFFYDPETGVWAKMGQGIESVFKAGQDFFFGENGFWQKAYNKGSEVGDFFYNPNDGVWAKFYRKGEEVTKNLGLSIYGENGFWAKVRNKGSEVGNFYYDPNEGLWAKIYKNGKDFFTNLGLDIYGGEGFWAKVWSKSKEVGNFFYNPNDGLWAKIYSNGKKFFTDLGLNIYGANGFWAKVWDKASEIWTKISELFEGGFKIKMPHFKWDSEGGIEAPQWAKGVLEALDFPTKLPKLSVDWYAQGGFPETGSLFFAGEAGAEILGTVGGKTTVAGGAEITGISDTIRQTSSEEIQLLRQQNQLLQGILQKEFGILKNDLYKSVRSSDNEYRKMTGRSAFA